MPHHSRFAVACSVLATALLVGACSEAPAQSGPTPVAVPSPTDAPPIAISSAEKGLTFRYFPKSGPAKNTSSIDSVPADTRAQVLVIPESVEVPPGLAYVADLRTAGADGKYPYVVMTQGQLDAQLAEARAAAAPRPSEVAGVAKGPSTAPGSSARASTGGQNEVIMFSTSWCGVCSQARRWFKNKGIDFVDRDIENDAAAEADLVQKASSVGVDRGSLTGVPIIWVNGKLFPGFDPGKIQAALHS